MTRDAENVSRETNSLNDVETQAAALLDLASDLSTKADMKVNALLGSQEMSPSEPNKADTGEVNDCLVERLLRYLRGLRKNLEMTDESISRL